MQQIKRFISPDVQHKTTVAILTSSQALSFLSADLTWLDMYICLSLLNPWLHSGETRYKLKSYAVGCSYGYATFRSGRFGLGRFGLGHFRLGTFRSGPFRSGDISVRLWNLAEILHVHILMQTYLNQREVLLKNYKHGLTVNQHYMIFIIISKQNKSLLTFCN